MGRHFCSESTLYSIASLHECWHYQKSLILVNVHQRLLENRMKFCSVKVGESFFTIYTLKVCSKSLSKKTFVIEKFDSINYPLVTGFLWTLHLLHVTCIFSFAGVWILFSLGWTTKRNITKSIELCVGSNETYKTHWI